MERDENLENLSRKKIINFVFSLEKENNFIYQIPCSDCDTSCIEETYIHIHHAQEKPSNNCKTDCNNINQLYYAEIKTTVQLPNIVQSQALELIGKQWNCHIKNAVEFPNIVQSQKLQLIGKQLNGHIQSSLLQRKKIQRNFSNKEAAKKWCIYT